MTHARLPLSGKLGTLLEAAARAPSGDNVQPWRLVVDAVQGCIAVQVDEGRDRSPMNADQRMSRIACGAAVENVLRTAGFNGWQAELVAGTGPERALILVPELSGAGGQLEPAIVARVSNRRPYDSQPLPAAELARLAAQTAALQGVRATWITGADRLRALATHIGRADALMFGESMIRRAFLANVRFDAPSAECVTEGLSLAALELSAADRLALRCILPLPQWLFRFSSATRVFAQHARRLVESAAGLVVVVAPDKTAATDWLVGRVMQRVWLELTAAGLAVQPMMSLLILANLLEHGSPEMLHRMRREPLAALLAELRTCVPELGPDHPAFLLRFGRAPAPSGRTGRRPVETLVDCAPLSLAPACLPG